jgi:hypothetical protein
MVIQNWVIWIVDIGCGDFNSIDYGVVDGYDERPDYQFASVFGCTSPELSTDGESLYWLEYPRYGDPCWSDSVINSPGRVVKKSLDSPHVQTVVAPDQLGPISVAVGGEFVYWLNVIDEVGTLLRTEK